ncbi:MAG: hypothetical protein AAF479_09740 [Pseudomonadota bacterium]
MRPGGSGPKISAELELRLLGAPEAAVDGTNVSLTGRAADVIAALAAARPAWVTREQLAEDLFGDDAASTTPSAVHVNVLRGI